VLGLPDWPAVKTLTLTLEPAGDGFQARVVACDGEATETPWLQGRVATGAACDGQVDLDALKAASTEVLDHARIYGDLARNGLGFGPYLEGIARAFRLAGGGLLCELRDDAPQQDWFRKNLALPSTALGAAWLAGYKAGVWPGMDEFSGSWHLDRRFEPQMAESERTKLHAGWQDAVRRTRSA
jgi:hypothetical protein